MTKLTAPDEAALLTYGEHNGSYCEVLDIEARRQRIVELLPDMCELVEDEGNRKWKRLVQDMKTVSLHGIGGEDDMCRDCDSRERLWRLLFKDAVRLRHLMNHNECGKETAAAVGLVYDKELAALAEEAIHEWEEM